MIDPIPLAGLRLGIPQGRPLAGLDTTVRTRFSEASAALSRAGARISDETIPLIDTVLPANGPAVLLVRLFETECYAIHRDRLAARRADFDGFNPPRFEGGRNTSAADYIALLRERAGLVRAMDERLRDLDALVLPTVAVVAPTIAEVSTSLETYIARNGLIGRNTVIVNFFDLCAISIPCPRAGGLPVGLMLVARNGQDRKLFRMAAAVERLLA